MSAVRVGLIGLGGVGQTVLAALRQLEGVELISVADRDPALAEQVGRAENARAYDDYRSLVVESRPDLLLAVDPPFATNEYLALAAERGIHAWRTAPWERSFEGAARLVKAFQRAGRQLAVAAPWRHVPGVPDEQARRDLQSATFASAVANRCWPETLGWMGDRRRAGGGALLQLAYPWLDWITRLLGLPEVVMAAMGTAGPLLEGEAHDTEDAACAVLRFSRGRVGAVTASWSSAVPDLHLSVTARREHWVFTLGGAGPLRAQPAGQAEVMTQCCQECPLEAWQADLGGLLASFASPKGVPSGGGEHLAAMAVMESAYLSARTGQPEEPARFYQLHDLAAPTSSRAGGAAGQGASGRG